MAFVRGANPIWLMVDLTGNILDDTYYAFFLQNTLPYLPQDMYEDPEGNVIWQNPIQFQPSGTLPNNLFFDDTLVYRIEIRQGNNQSAPLIWLIENYMPDQPIPEDMSSGAGVENMISNPQFAVVNFYNIMNVNASAGYGIPVAPDWVLTYTGASGTLTVTQIPYSGADLVPTNPPYALSVASTGSGTIKLTQTFQDQGAIWQGQAIQFSVTAQVTGSTTNLTAQLIPSTLSGSNIPTTILTSTPLTAGYAQYTQVNVVSPNQNTDDPPIANSQVVLSWVAGSTVNITSVQLLATANILNPVVIPYQQITVERQIDHLFNYYNIALQFKPIKSFLIGWDFPLNPTQFGSNGTLSATPAYIMDQTIAADTAGTATWTFDPITDGLQITTVSTNNAYCLIQYLGGAQVSKMLGTQMAVNVNAYNTASTGVTMQVYLYRAGSPGVIPTLPNIIGSLEADGTFNLTAPSTTYWTQINNNNLGLAQATLSNVTSTSQINGSDVDYEFIGYEIQTNAQIANTTLFAIVVTFAYTSASTVTTINSISLVPGSIGTRPAPQTPSEVLSECQTLYETSYLVPTHLPGSVASANSLAFPLIMFPAAGTTTFGSHTVYAQTIGFSFAAPKRSTGYNLTCYSSQTGTVNAVAIIPYNNGSALTSGDIGVGAGQAWAVGYGGTLGVQLTPITGSPVLTIGSSFAGAAQNAAAQFHYVADNRYGVVP